jgi:hypothetical protein
MWYSSLVVLLGGLANFLPLFACRTAQVKLFRLFTTLSYTEGIVKEPPPPAGLFPAARQRIGSSPKLSYPSPHKPLDLRDFPLCSTN